MIERTEGNRAPATSRRGRRAVVPLLLIVVATLSVYGSSLFGEFVLDDTFLIVQNSHVREADLRSIFGSSFLAGTSRHRSDSFYRPLVIASFALNFALGGLDPVGYHFFNILCHVASVYLVFLVARLLLSSNAAATVAALLFACHPVSVESVAWISGRTELLAGLCCLVAFWGIVRAAPPTAAPAPQRAFAWLSVLAFALGLLAKESAVTFVPVVALYLLGFRRWACSSPRTAAREGLLLVIPFVAVTTGYVLLRGLVLGVSIPVPDVDSFQNPLVTEPFLPRLWTTFVLLAEYARLLAWPGALSVDYSYAQIPVARSVLDARVLAGAALAAALIALAAFARRRSPPASFGIAAFLGFGSLMLANAVRPFGVVLAERFLYLPLVGFVLFVVALGMWVVRAVGNPWVRKGAVTVVVTVVSLLAARSVVRNLDWRDELRLYASSARSAPRSAMLQSNLGHGLRIAGRLEEARRHYERALQIDEGYPFAHLGLAILSLEQKDYSAAEKGFRRALIFRATMDRAYVGLGAVLIAQGRLDEAVRYLEIARSLNPSNPNIYFQLAVVAHARGDLQANIALLRRVVALDPQHAAALLNLGRYYAWRGNAAAAQEYYARFLRVAPPAMEAMKAEAERYLRRWR